MGWNIKLKLDWCKEYNIECVNVLINENDVIIYDSYKILQHAYMKDVIDGIKSYAHLTNVACERSNFSLISEWKAHNILYYLGIMKNRTKDCDLNDEKWYKKVGYFILSIFYIW